MFTSRAEYRILLRQDNADIRLTPIGREIGLVGDEMWQIFEQKKSLVESLISFAHNQSVKISEIESYLKRNNFEPLTQGRKLYALVSRNEFSFLELVDELPRLKKFVTEQGITREIIEQAEIQIKYKGYIEREKLLAEKLHRLENISIPDGFDYTQMNALTIEARQKLTKIQPRSIGQASRIPGVSPADINVLLIKFGR
jgi:tRNA uridine 5-carboxymethylaminomethyl modification enzyme